MKAMETLVVGRITTVFGVRGWVKVHSYTDQVETLFSYNPWLIATDSGTQQLEIDNWRRQGDSLVAHIKGIDDRDIAKTWCGKDILVEKGKLPNLDADDYYWHQLQGLAVNATQGGQPVRLGVVKSLLETGANDVLVVKGDSQSVDREERLIPYVDEYVVNVDIGNQTIDVNWDPEF